MSRLLSACVSFEKELADCLSERAGVKITAHDIRSGRAKKIMEEVYDRECEIAAEEGRRRREQEERQHAKRMKKLKKKLAKAERKLEELNGRNKDTFG